MKSQTEATLKALLPAFQHWYNEQRLYSRLEYRPPAAVLADEVAAALLHKWNEGQKIPNVVKI